MRSAWRQFRSGTSARKLIGISSALTLLLLGGFELRHESGDVVRFARPRRKAQALLAYLACHAGQTHLRDKLAALLWPDMELGRFDEALG